MSLIACSECGKEISSKAVACPNCGCPVTKQDAITETAQYKMKIATKLNDDKLNNYTFAISKRQNQSVINEYSTGDMITLYDANGKALTSVEISDCIYAQSKYIPWVYFKFDTLDEDAFKNAVYIAKSAETVSVIKNNQDFQNENLTSFNEQTPQNTKSANSSQTGCGIVLIIVIAIIVVLVLNFSEGNSSNDDKCDVCKKSAYSSLNGEEFCYKHYKEAIDYYLD